MDGRGEHVPDNDWISRRWQGEGQVVRRDPARKGDPPVSASSESTRLFIFAIHLAGIRLNDVFIGAGESQPRGGRYAV
jgi:hypothetical protein